jgi:hypothetical protein
MRPHVTTYSSHSMKKMLRFNLQIPRLCLVALLYLIVQISSAAAQVGSSTPVSNNSYNLGDVLARSALGGQVRSFTPLSIWNFTDGWLEPWIPPPKWRVAFATRRLGEHRFRVFQP